MSFGLLQGDQAVRDQETESTMTSTDVLIPNLHAPTSQAKCHLTVKFRRVLLAAISLFLLISLFAPPSTAMKLDPARIAARLRIEGDWDATAAGIKVGRNRRQLIGGTPPEETIQITTQIFSGRLFEYGLNAGDKQLSPGLDVTKKLKLSNPISFYGQKHSTIFVLSNGGIGFDASARTYRPNVLPGPLKLIIPFWNRNDLRNGGHVFYREVLAGRALDRGQSEIRYQYDHDVKVTSAVIVTFVKMQPLGTDSLPDENTNTFQVALLNTANGTTYANFIYNNIGWTQGAEAGFSSGDGTAHYALPTSGTGNIMYLEDSGNTGIPGEWMFILNDDRVLRCKAGIKGDTCDETCAGGEWGFDCTGCCHCAGGAQCNNVTGSCGNSGCAGCWSGDTCQEKTEQCKAQAKRQCALNALLFTDYDRCGEPSQRCECLTGYEGDGYEQCRDVDECAQPGTCHEKAVCTNTPGRFFCQCTEGFTGDGVSECVVSFLFPHDNAQKLSNARNSRVDWQLKYPLRIFGKERDRITISNNGLVVVKELNKDGSENARHLEEMEVLGIAPFFMPSDSAHHGEVLVAESTDSDVLTRVTQLINEQLEGGTGSFTATNALVITFLNVSSDDNPKALNTFQTLLVGGRDMTFAAFLYKDLVWSDGAEAGIMTIDKTNSIHLPGSGTPGMEQLSQLSNIRSPGIWIFRIDKEVVFPCMQPDLQPPYCDARSPTLVSRKPPPGTSPATSAAETHSPTTSITPTITTVATTQSSIHEPAPSPFRPLAPEHQEVIEVEEPPLHSSRRRPSSSSISVESPPQRVSQGKKDSRQWAPSSPSAEEEDEDEQRKAPVATVTPRKPKPALVTLQSQEIMEQPPDVFDVTFPPFLTVIPRLFTAETKQSSREQQVESVQQVMPSEVINITPDLVPKTNGRKQGSAERNGSNQNTRPANGAEGRQSPRKDSPPTSKKQQFKVDFHADDDSHQETTKGQGTILIEQPSQTIVPERVNSPQATSSNNRSPPEKQVQQKKQGHGSQEEQPRPKQRLPGTVLVEPMEPGRVSTERHQTKAIEVITAAPDSGLGPKESTTKEAMIEPKTSTMMTVSTESAESPTTTTSNNNPKLFVFTTAKSQEKPSPTKPPKTANSPPPKLTKPPQVISADGDADAMPYDPVRVLNAEAQGSRLSVIIPIAIVVVWLVVLVVVAGFLCCKRRQSQDRLRTMYGPAYQIRPMGAGYPVTLRGDKHLYEGSYEDHLEKAARLSSAEMSAAYHPGRLSLCAPGSASYWNLSPSGSSGSAGSSGANRAPATARTELGSPPSVSVTAASTLFNGGSSYYLGSSASTANTSTCCRTGHIPYAHQPQQRYTGQNTRH